VKNLPIIILLFAGVLCFASTNPKDTIYTNTETLLKEISSTNKQTATYYLVLKNSDDRDIKVRVDLKTIDAEIPLYKSGEFDVKKLLALKEESLEAPKKKFAEFESKLNEWKIVNQGSGNFKNSYQEFKNWGQPYLEHRIY
jgi:hypothetical protein